MFFFLSISIAYKRIQAHKYQICIRYSRYAIDQYNYTHNGTAPSYSVVLRYIIQIYTNGRSRASTGVFIIRLHMYVCINYSVAIYIERLCGAFNTFGVAESFLLSLVLNLLINHHRCRCRRRICSPRFLRLSTIQYSIQPRREVFHDRSFIYTVAALDESLSYRNHTWPNSSCSPYRELYLHENCEITNNTSVILSRALKVFSA